MLAEEQANASGRDRGRGRGRGRGRVGRVHGRGRGERGRGGSGGRGGRGKNRDNNNRALPTPDLTGDDAVGNNEMQTEERSSSSSAVRNGSSRKKGLSSRRRAMFPDYMEEELVRLGLETGTLLQGSLRVNAKNPSESFVSVEKYRRDIAVIGSRQRNRAFDGDIVALQLCPRSEWRRRAGPSSSPNRVDGNDKNDDDVAVEEQQQIEQIDLAIGQKLVRMDGREAAEQDDENDLQPLARVVHILERSVSATVDVVGYLRCSNGTQKVPNDSEQLMFIPFARTSPRALVSRKYWPKKISSSETDDVEEVWNSIYSTSFEPWLSMHRFPSTTALERVGSAGHVEPETEALLRAARISHRAHFDADVIASLSKFEERSSNGHWAIPSEEIERRRDLRSRRIFTIDPLTAKDLDDALHVEAMPDGTTEIGVHIADVSYFVREGSAVDMEARKRCTSVYLVQAVIPMLPPLLCEQLCSLNPSVDRLAFSVIWRMDREGRVCKEPSPWFGRTVIKSCGKLDYGTAQKMIDGDIVNVEDLPEHIVITGDHSVEEVVADCRRLHEVAAKRRQHRFETGSLRLDRPKMSFKFGAGGVNDPVSVGPYQLHQANFLVEEYMLLANKMVARHLADNVPAVGLLRRHEEPVDTVLEETVKLCASAGYAIDAESAASLHYTLQQISDEQVRGFISVLLSVAMKRAMYFCIDGGENPASWVHYALNFDTYTHFTSPIRRYADVLVHRMLAHCISSEEKLPGAEDVAMLADRCNDMKARAKEAQDMSLLMYLAVLLRKKTLIEDAVLLDTGVKTVSVYLPRLGLEERLFLDRVEDASRAEVVRGNGDESGPGHLEIEWNKNEGVQKIGLFQSMKVKLGVTDQVPFKIQLQVLSPSAAKSLIADEDPSTKH